MTLSPRIAALALTFALAACGAPTGHGSTLPRNSDGSSRQMRDAIGGIPDSPATFSVALFDAPPPGDAKVIVGLASVAAVSNGAATTLVSYPTPLRVELTALRTTPLILAGSVAPGAYDHLRFVLSPADSSFVAGGVTYPIMVGWKSSSTIAFDLPIHAVYDGVTPVSLAIDFNVYESLAWSSGSDHAWLLPKIVVAHHPASISGRVANAAGAAVAGATIVVSDGSGNTVNTTVSGSDGSFQMHAIEAGSYQLSVKNVHVTQSGQIGTASASAGLVPGPPVPITLSAGDSLNVGTLLD